MPMERKNAALFGGKSVSLLGPELKIGDKAPDFSAVDAKLNTVSLSSLPSSVIILSSVPSLDTGLCSAQTHRFEEEISKLEGKAELITISMDLPFAQGRFCGGAPKPHTLFLSDHVSASFGTNYGTLIPSIRLLNRAVFVVGKDGLLVHVQYMQDNGQAVNYDAALEAVRKEIEKK